MASFARREGGSLASSVRAFTARGVRVGGASTRTGVGAARSASVRQPEASTRGSPDIGQSSEGERTCITI
jgi:hypothetical protein